MSGMKRSSEEIRVIFLAAGINIDESAAHRFVRFRDLIIERNEELDLTRITNPADIVVRHFIDSAFIASLIDLPSPLLDIGSGAGFPGIPLAILKPDMEIILAEPRKKRANFLETAVRELGLKNVTVYPHMVTDKTFLSVRGAVTRALEPIDRTLSRVAHFLPAGGMVVFMKGPSVDKDIDEISAVNRDAYELQIDREYQLPGTDYRRRVVVFRKNASSFRKSFVILKSGEASAGIAITSSENRRFREFKKLADGTGVRKTGLTLVSGTKLIIELAKNPAVAAKCLILPDGYVEDDVRMNAVITSFENTGSLVVLKKSLFKEIDPYGAGGALLIVETPIIGEWEGDMPTGCCVALPFQDPINVGAAVRSAAAFGAGTCLMLAEAATPFHAKSIRASAGAVFSIRMMRGPSIHELREAASKRGVAIVALDRKGTPLPSFEFPERFILLPGMEGPGLPEELRSNAVSIPLHASVESLNGPVALSIALYEWWRRYSPSN